LENPGLEALQLLQKFLALNRHYGVGSLDRAAAQQ
jgi:hypothetical protein